MLANIVERRTGHSTQYEFGSSEIPLRLKEPASIKVVQSNSSPIEARLIIGFISKVKTKESRPSDFPILPVLDRTT